MNEVMDEARSVERDAYRKRNVQIQKKIFLACGERLDDEKRQKADGLSEKHMGLKGFYLAQEKIREM